MSQHEYISHLYKIARHLNQEYSLPAALRIALEKTIELLQLETGWIWLVQGDSKSVYLATSHNLPPALAKHPERLSGWCYCIKKYLSDDISEATNISEITCTRLKDISSGTRGMKYHATIPILIQGEKVGLMNLMTKETQQLGDAELSLLNTISELIGMAIQRTRLQEIQPSNGDNNHWRENLERALKPEIQGILEELKEVGESKPEIPEKVQSAVHRLQELRKQLDLLFEDSQEEITNGNEQEFHYPTSPLTKREMEVLGLVRKGFTNQQIAEQLYIAERTVKFHLTSILSKLYAKTRTEAVDIALKRGLLSL